MKELNKKSREQRKSWNGKPYRSLDYMLRERFGEKVYKVTLNGGMSCPNRDGTLGTRGCIFCSEGGSGDFAADVSLSVTEQIESQIALLSAKRPIQKYIAYFQAYTNTYAPVEYLRKIFKEAMSHPGIVALSVGTRPDCLGEEVLDLLEELNRIKPVWIELGLQTIHEKTAQYIRRGYRLSCFDQAVENLRKRNIEVIVHTILGLPGESREEILHHADILSALPLTTLKLHQLQLIRGTRMAREQAEHPEQFHLYTADEYIDLVIDFIERLNPSIVVERFVSQSPKELLIAPDWGLKNFEFTAKVNKRISERNARQGRLLNPPSSEPVLPGM